MLKVPQFIHGSLLKESKHVSDALVSSSKAKSNHIGHDCDSWRFVSPFVIIFPQLAPYRGDTGGHDFSFDDLGP